MNKKAFGIKNTNGGYLYKISNNSAYHFTPNSDCIALFDITELRDIIRNNRKEKLIPFVEMNGTKYHDIFELIQSYNKLISAGVNVQELTMLKGVIIPVALRNGITVYDSDNGELRVSGIAPYACCRICVETSMYEDFTCDSKTCESVEKYVQTMTSSSNSTNVEEDKNTNLTGNNLDPISKLKAMLEN